MATEGATSSARRTVLVLALVALLGSAYAALGPRGDISIRADCRGTALSAYVQPQAQDPGREALGFVDPARFCNLDAVQRVHVALVLLVAAGVLAAAPLVVRLRQR